MWDAFRPQAASSGDSAAPPPPPALGAPPSPAAAAEDHRSTLVAFYETHNPAKLTTVDATLAKYKGREAELFVMLRKKYSEGAPPAERSKSELEQEMDDAEAEILGAATPVEEMAATPMVSSQDALTKARTETERKERQIKRSLSSQRDRIRKESARLALFDGELAKLKQKEAADVAGLRDQLELADRDLVWLERDYKTKEAAYFKAKEAFETAGGRKREIKESMTLLVLNSERRKEEKLNELMAKMDAADDVA